MMSFKKIDPKPTLGKDVRDTARHLYKLLLPRIRNQIKGDFFCNSCQMMHASSKAVNILYDNLGVHPGWTSDWTKWLVEMQNPSTKETLHYRDLSHFIPQEELYVIFREAFEPVRVMVRRPHADAHRDASIEDYKHQFKPSGKSVTLRKAGDSFCVRPRKKSRYSLWKIAEVKMQYHFQSALTTGLTCRVDYDIADMGRRPSDTHDGGWRSVQGGLTFYVSQLMYEQVYSGIARLVATDAATGAHTFELDEGVELCDASTSYLELIENERSQSKAAWCLEKFRALFGRKVKKQMADVLIRGVDYGYLCDDYNDHRPITICKVGDILTGGSGTSTAV